LRHTTSIGAGSDVEFCCDFLVRQLIQAVTAWRLAKNRLQFLPIISAIAKLQLIYRPLLVVLPITLA
jgi:hypothetical protein